MYDFLQDKYFLNQFDNLRLKEQFVRLTILNWQEEPVSEIQGKAISGSLNLNGSSSLRRTANLTLFAEENENDLSQINGDLSINRKVKLEIGFLNTVPNYVYEARDQQTQVSTLQEIDFVQRYGEKIWFPLGIFVIFDPNITHGTNGVNISISLKDKMCLLNGDAGGVLPASTEFHKREQEDEEGIVTVDYPVMRQIIQECVHHWGEEDPARIIIEDLDDRIKQVVRWMGDEPVYYAWNVKNNVTTNNYFLTYAEALAFAGGDPDKVTTYEYGDEVGFVMTDFTYPGELIGDAGETVTSILDKIINVLGNYEYFYDVYGNFHFQEIKNYLNITYTTQALKDGTIGDIDYSADFVGGKAAYYFAGSTLISSFANAPKYSNIKNDYVVWGVRKSVDDSEIPIRYHLVVDTVPEKQIIDGKSCYAKHQVVWYEDEYGVKRARVWTSNTPPAGEVETVYSYDWREELYFQGIAASSTGSEFSYYFPELLWEWPKIWDFDTHKFKDKYQEHPNKIDYYLDVINMGSELGKYGVPNIGRRGVVVSEDKINCVFEREVPDIVLLDNSTVGEKDRQECVQMGQVYAQVSDTIFNLLSMGGIQNSCYQRVCELLYQHTTMNNTITIQSLPIYYLEPNTRINVSDPSSGIYGDFMIQTISLPLAIDGMMSITANKALQKI